MSPPAPEATDYAINTGPNSPIGTREAGLVTRARLQWSPSRVFRPLKKGKISDTRPRSLITLRVPPADLTQSKIHTLKSSYFIPCVLCFGFRFLFHSGTRQPRSAMPAGLRASRLPACPPDGARSLSLRLMSSRVMFVLFFGSRKRLLERNRFESIRRPADRETQPGGRVGTMRGPEADQSKLRAPAGGLSCGLRQSRTPTALVCWLASRTAALQPCNAL